MLFLIGKLESKKEDIRYGRTVEGNSDTLVLFVIYLIFTSIFSLKKNQ